MHRARDRLRGPHGSSTIKQPPRSSSTTTHLYALRERLARRNRP
jgi:hypothetical protein